MQLMESHLAIAESSAAKNPLLERWIEIMGPHYEREEKRREEFRKTGRWDFAHLDNIEKHLEPYTARRELVLKYAWAVPDDAALDTIKRYSPRGVVEIGAGTGYWAGLLRERGVEVAAYDRHPYRSGHADGCWSQVKRGGPYMASFHPMKTLFLSWPPYADTMASRCLDTYAGNTLAYIGEGPGGCTGDDDFHHKLETEWDVITEIGIPQWEGIHDRLSIYHRKGTWEKE